MVPLVTIENAEPLDAFDAAVIDLREMLDAISRELAFGKAPPLGRLSAPAAPAPLYALYEQV